MTLFRRHPARSLSRPSGQSAPLPLRARETRPRHRHGGNVHLGPKGWRLGLLRVALAASLCLRSEAVNASVAGKAPHVANRSSLALAGLAAARR
jgi:hypothetical protein